MPMPNRPASRRMNSTILLLAVAQVLPKLVASLEAGNPPDVTRLGSGYVHLYRSQGHLLDVTDMVEKMQKAPGWTLPGLPRRSHA